ncbi:DUF2914 domain-containing protein [bacterium]|nr:DUF2914 domain-containing protein [bacterium]
MRILRQTFIMALLLCATAAVAEETSVVSLDVVEMVVAAGFDRENRLPQAAGEVFPGDTERLWCYTRVRGAATPIEVVHAWYHEGETRARVVLPVRSADWRTWSSKRLLPAWTGRWEVKVLDPDGLVLASRTFTIVPVSTVGEDTE